ncbi:pantoate--beta-alanine ligase [Flavobacterium sp.]|uniref:pantoate--beta-alanine ligase n=1 Tax=Flavobacterium sp. TaxID=239 RepID=UPI00333F60B2
MLLFNNKVQLTKHLQSISVSNSSIGFVPTMGALHLGHLSLLEKSIQNNNHTVISIFVNPTQFNNPEDLEKYPRTLESDIQKIKSISDAILIYAPTVDDIYEGNTASRRFDFDGLEHQMEGKYRAGHFDGVGTVVKRLFEIVKPTNAYFGEKDFQQLQIIKKLVEKENIPVNVIECPIYREANGLAMSSRNERLTAIEREKVAVIYKILTQAKTLFLTETCASVKDFVTEEFNKHPEIELEYFEIAEEETLISCDSKELNKNYRAFIAVFVNKIRLIDTISLK